MDLTFVRSKEEFGQSLDIPLKEGGESTSVTLSNKQEYVHLWAQSVLRDATKPQLEAFSAGFSKLIPAKYLRPFTAQELQRIMSGDGGIDVDLLKRRTEYQGCTSESDIVCWLWTILEEFDENQRSDFIQFITGSRQIPVRAKYSRSWSMKVRLVEVEGGRLPTASTCFNTLHLPHYKELEQMKEKLSIAISLGKEGILKY
ncbi:E3 ubiquitin-protein ligase RSP5 [Lamellibrachia satsuma]|nr:E3 ubiquitin-protein ligase RSP5 [Lamellibrachia satsuma]